MSTPLLLTPGPTIVPPAVREALAKPMLHHRTAEFQSILKEAAAGLKVLFGTSQEVLILTSSGTGAMEAAVINLLSRGDEALVIQGGKFGERWAEICRAYGIEVVSVDPEWGKPLDLDQLRQTLQAHPKVKAVFSTLCETSTGVVFPTQEIRKAMGDSSALLVVDAISGLGSDSFAMDEWGVDVTVCGSQKGLMLPPGLAFIALSPRAWELVERSTSTRYYLDLRAAKKAWEKCDTPFTPGVNLIVGLVASLNFILGDGLERFQSGHRARAEQVRKALVAMGLTLFADSACASNAVTSARVPEGVDGKALVKKLRSEQGVAIAGGQGKELAGKIIRIATMGAVGENEIQQGLTALEAALKEMKVTHG